MIVVPRAIQDFTTLYCVVFMHVLWGLSFGNPHQEVHFIIAFILFYFTKRYILDTIPLFSRANQREAEWIQRKLADWLG